MAKDTGQLIEDLGSRRFEVREAATRALMENAEAEPALRKFLKSEDTEVRRRVLDILAALQRKRGLRGLARIEALAKDGRVIEVVDRLVYGSEWDRTGEGWSALMQFADKLIDAIPPHDAHLKELKKRFRELPFLAGDFHQFAKAEPLPQEIFGRDVTTKHRHHVLVRGDRVTWGKTIEDGPCVSILAASEEAQVACALGSLIFVGGNVKIMNWEADRSIIICDGDVEISAATQSCLIIARGKITSRLNLDNSVVRNQDFLHLPIRRTINLKDGTPDPFAFVKFFEIADVGLFVADSSPQKEPAGEGVRLKEVRKDSPFASGLRGGDVVTALDGTKVASEEDFRRKLRRKLAQGGPFLTFTVRRAGGIRDVPLRVKD
jgi:hypothetical protein